MFDIVIIVIGFSIVMGMYAGAFALMGKYPEAFEEYANKRSQKISL